MQNNNSNKFKGASGKISNAYPTSSTIAINLGFRPTYMVIETDYTGGVKGFSIYNEKISTTTQCRGLANNNTNSVNRAISVASGYVCTFAEINSTGVIVNAYNSKDYGTTLYYFAMQEL